MIHINMETKPNAAIFILTQNNEIRKTYLKTCLYFLFKYYNAQFEYPVCILHEGDYDPHSQREIVMSVRKSCRHLITFVALDKDDFTLPPHVDAEKMHNCIATNAVPYWRDEKYRMMCRWWMVHMHKYASGYDYIMRIDDDAFIEEPITHDLFKWMHDNNLVYSSNMVHVDCGICCYGLRECLEKLHPDKKDVIDKMFLMQDIPMRSIQFHPFRLLLSITHEENPPQISEKMKISMPVIYYNNFFITKTDFWQRDDVQQTISDLDATGNIFYYRWGDAPLQTAVVALHAEPSRVKRSVFAYSKRLQRESFADYKKEWQSYMPETYTKTSCIIQDQQKS